MAKSKRNALPPLPANDEEIKNGSYPLQVRIPLATYNNLRQLAHDEVRTPAAMARILIEQGIVRRVNDRGIEKAP